MRRIVVSVRFRVGSTRLVLWTPVETLKEWILIWIGDIKDPQRFQKRSSGWVAMMNSLAKGWLFFQSTGGKT